MENELKHDVLANYPYPIAIFLKKCINDERLVNRKKSSHQSLFYSLLDAFEMTNRFLAIMAVSNYVQAGAFSDGHNAKIAEKLRKNLSLGDWQELLRETLRIFSEKKMEKLAEPRLFDFYFRKQGKHLRQQKVVSLFDEFIQIRNRKKGHSLNLTPDEYKVLCQEFKPKLYEILSRLSFLKEYTILTPIESNECFLLEYMIMKGSKVEECFEELHIGLESKEGDILLYHEETSEVRLVLSPLSFFEFDYETDMEQYLCLYEGNKRNKSEVKSLTYLGFTPAPKNKYLYAHQIEDIRSEWLLNFTKIFMSFLKDDYVGETVPELSSRFNPQMYYFESQIAQIDFYQKTFIGRAEVLNEINHFMDAHNSGQYLLTGVPGQGKTAIMAKLVHDCHYVHHFISDQAGRNDETSMIQSLYVQISKKMNRDVEPEIGNKEFLGRAFGNLLQEFSSYCSEHGKKEAILIDGLDELYSYKDVITMSYFPNYMPPNLFVIYSSRPVAALSGVEPKISRKKKLENLSYEEIKQLVYGRLPMLNHQTFIDVYHYSLGNPLFVKCLIDSLELENTSKVKTIPNTIEKLFQSLMEKLREDDNEVSLHVLGLLTVAKEGLSVHELAGMLNISKYKMTKSLKGISQYLIKSETKYWLFHKKFYDFLLDDLEEMSFDQEEIKKYHHMIISYCEPYEEKQLNYSLHYLPYHYYETKNYDRLMVLLEKESFHVKFMENLHDIIKDTEQPRTNKFLNRLIDGREIHQSFLLNTIDLVLNQGSFTICMLILTELELKLKNAKKQLGLLTYLKARIYREIGELKKAEELLESLTLEIESDNFKMKVALTLANTARESGDRQKAIKYYQKALIHCNKNENPDHYLEISHHISDMDYVQSRFDKAKQDLDEALALAESHKLELRMGQIHRIKGQIYFILDHFDEAIVHYTKSLHSFSKVNDLIHLGKIYNNLAEVYVYKDLEMAEHFVATSLSLNDTLNKKLEKAKAQMIKGLIYGQRREVSLLGSWIEESVESLEQVGYLSGIGKALHHHAFSLLSNSQYKRAIEESKSSNEYFLNRKTKGYEAFIMKNFLLQSAAFNKLGNFEQAARALAAIPAYILEQPDLQKLYNKYRDRIERELIS